MNRKTTTSLTLVASLSVLIWACGDDAMHSLGDMMSDAGRAMRDSTADALEDGGDAMQDMGRADAQSCTTCGRRFQLAAPPTSNSEGVEFNVDAYSALHIACVPERDCRFIVDAQFGSSWVRVMDTPSPYVPRSYTLAPIASVYRVIALGSTVLVNGEIREER